MGESSLRREFDLGRIQGERLPFGRRERRVDEASLERYLADHFGSGDATDA
jgi:hypothetical protein